MSPLRAVAAALLCLALFYPSWAEAGGVEVVEPWARATPGASKIGAAYFELRASKDSGGKLVGASTPAAERAEIHTHVEEDGVMKMRRIDAIDVPAGEGRLLKPGGLHIMLFGLKSPLKEGEKLPLTLEFQEGGSISVEAPILAAGSKGPHAGEGEGEGHSTQSGAGSDHGSHEGSGSGSGE